jgi:hypothetical protein
MPTPTIPLLVLIAFLCLLLPDGWRALRFLRLNSPAAHRQRALAAETRGWQYRRGPFARPLLYTLNGQTKEGIPWQLAVCRQRATTRGSLDRGFAYSHWQAKSARPAGNGHLLIAPRLPAMGRFLEPFYGRQFMLRAILPPDTAQFADLPEVTAGTDTLRRRYAIQTNDEESARRLLTAAIESSLLDWPFQPKNPWYAPIILADEDGLQIRLLVAVYDLPVLEYLVNLGQALISADTTR